MAKTDNRSGFGKSMDIFLQKMRRISGAGSGNRGNKNLGTGMYSDYGNRVSDVMFKKRRESLPLKRKAATAQSGIGIKNTLRYAAAQSDLKEKAKLKKRTRPILSTQGTLPKKTWSVPTDRYKIVAPVINRKR